MSNRNKIVFCCVGTSSSAKMLLIGKTFQTTCEIWILCLLLSLESFNHIVQQAYLLSWGQKEEYNKKIDSQVCWCRWEPYFLLSRSAFIVLLMQCSIPTSSAIVAQIPFPCCCLLSLPKSLQKWFPATLFWLSLLCLEHWECAKWPENWLLATGASHLGEQLETRLNKVVICINIQPITHYLRLLTWLIKWSIGIGIFLIRWKGHWVQCSSTSVPTSTAPINFDLSRISVPGARRLLYSTISIARSFLYQD